MNTKKKSTLSVRYLTTAAIIAALYVVLTFLSAAFGLASGVIQFRLSEALAVLPFFTPAAVPGVTIGCFLANLLTASPVYDVIFGTLATFLGVFGAALLKRHPFLIALPTILSNALIIPLVLQLAYGVPDAIWYLILTVGLGELLSAGVLGTLLLQLIKKRKLL